ncbi:hypothetical protein [Bartonella pachyuromydis]
MGYIFYGETRFHRGQKVVEAHRREVWKVEAGSRKVEVWSVNNFQPINLRS